MAYFDTKTGSLEEAIKAAVKNETNKNNKSDDGEGMDAVQPKAVKKKFADRKDKDNATKNIILQLRKVLSLNGKNPVEFSSGKKEKVHPNVAAAALTKFEKLRRTDQKDEFQQKIAKSYKDLLNAVKGK